MATILVVDDEPMMVKLCANVLTLGSHDVLQAGDAEEALQLLHDTPADLALLDVVMPGMSGIELASHIRRHYPKMDIVLMTGYGPKEIRQIAGKENPYRIILKPFKSESLLQMIENVLSSADSAGG